MIINIYLCGYCPDGCVDVLFHWWCRNIMAGDPVASMSVEVLVLVPSWRRWLSLRRWQIRVDVNLLSKLSYNILILFLILLKVSNYILFTLDMINVIIISTLLCLSQCLHNLSSSLLRYVSAGVHTMVSSLTLLYANIQSRILD